MIRAEFTKPLHKELAQEGFVADMHCHTHHSQDSQTPVAKLLARADRLGISVAFTDHNRIGGVIEAYKRRRPPVIPALEICTKEGKDIIPYFYDKGQLEEFYLKRLGPYLRMKNALRSSRMNITLQQLLDLLEDEECVVSLPHPFASPPRRSYNYLVRKKNAFLLRKIDVIETFNETMTRRANLSALGWAVQLRKGIVGGSDAHLLQRLGDGVTVTKATDIEGHLKLITQGHSFVVGKELKPHERVIDAQAIVRSKVTKGVTGSITKGISFSVRTSRKMLETLDEF